MMKYIIDRTSSRNNEKPCEEAKRELLTYLDWRTCKTLKEAMLHQGLGQSWFNEGSNHREEKGMVVRDMKIRDEWVVEIVDLNKFIEKYGNIILQISEYKECPLKIEIYDDYRE